MVIRLLERSLQEMQISTLKQVHTNFCFYKLFSLLLATPVYAPVHKRRKTKHGLYSPHAIFA